MIGRTCSRFSEAHKTAFFTRGFLIAVIVSFALLVGSMYFWANQSYQTATPQLANQTQQQIQTESKTLTATSIFLSNLEVSFYLMIPAVGVAVFFIVWHNTAYILGLLSYAYSLPPSAAVLNLTVRGFFEIFAYALLLSENLYIVALALTKKGAKERLKTQSWKTFLIYIALLFLAAVIEASALA